MPGAHRQGDARQCAATTIVVGQRSVTVNGRLWAVEGDENSHGAGELIASKGSVTIAGKKVIVHNPDQAQIDGLFHSGSADATKGHSGSVSAY